MKERIIRLLSIFNVEKGERYPVFYLLLQAFFLGVFNSSIYIIAHAFILKSEAYSKLPEAFVLAGGVSLFLIILFYIFIHSLSFKKAHIIFSIIIGAGILFILSADKIIEFPDYNFYLFSLVFPIQILSVQKFNSTIRYYFPGNQSVRFFGVLHNSREFGFIVLGFSLPLLIYAKFNINYLIYICIGSYLISLLFEFLFFKTTRLIETGQEQKNLKILDIFSNRFVRQMMFFLLLSSLIGFLIHYAFIVIARDNFQNSVGLLKFFSVFMGTMVLFVFLADRYLLNRILNNLGLPYSIILSPIFTGIFIALAAFIGIKFGYDKAYAGYAFFFMFFAAGKFIESLFKYSVETPSSNILLTSINHTDRESLKEFMQGPVVAASLLLAGIIIYIKSYFVEFNLLYVSFLIISLSVIWFYASIRLIKRFRNNLKLRFAEIGLERNHKDVLALPDKVENIIFTNFQEKNDEKSLYILKIIKALVPVSFIRFIQNYLNPHRKDILLSYILSEIGRYNLTQTLPTLQELKLTKNEDLKYQIENLKNFLNYLPEEVLSYEKTVDIIFSGNLNEKKHIIRLISERSDKDIERLLPLILKDIEPDIVFLAMLQAKNLQVDCCLEIIAEYLLHDVHYALAYEILKSFGEKSIPYVEALYYSDNVSQKEMIRIIRLLGDINSDQVIEGLLDKLDEVDSLIRKEVILSLRKHKFIGKGDKANIIIRQILRAVETCAWNMAVHLSFRRANDNELILEAINREIQENYIYIFSLLTLLYDTQKLNYIYNQITEGNSEILAYAIEMFDFILDDDLKQILFPLFEDSPYHIKISQLQYYFPIDITSSDQNLRKVINRENNLVSSWTKTCAIYYCIDHPKLSLVPELISCMFHPIKIIRETAAYVLKSRHPETFSSAYSRIPEDIKSEIDLALEFSKISADHLIFNRVKYFKLFNDHCQQIPDEQLVKFVSFFEHLYLEKGEVYPINEDDQAPLLWLFSGAIQITTKHSLLYKINGGQITDLNTIPNIHNIIAKESSILYILKRNLLNELLFENRELLEAFLKFMNEDRIFREENLKNLYEKVLI